MRVIRIFDILFRWSELKFIGIFSVDAYIVDFLKKNTIDF